MLARVRYVLLMVIFLGGCATSQDVRPYFEGAIGKFKDAESLEKRIVEVDASQQLGRFTTLFDQLESAALQSLRVLIVSGWNPSNGNFKEQHRGVAWASWFGVSSDTEITSLDRTAQRLIIAEYLNKTISIRVKVGLTNSEVPRDVSMYDQFTKYHGKGVGEGMEPATESDREHLEAEYGRWVVQFETDVLKNAPVFLAVVNARKAALGSVAKVKARRLERTELVYNNLIGISELGKQQAEALTRNVGFIQLANRVFAIANNLSEIDR